MLLWVLTDVLCRFNKTRHSFASDEEWFDYQELTEDHSKLVCGSTGQQYFPCPLVRNAQYRFAVFKLVEGQDVQQTESSIEEYKRANFGNIVANEAKKVVWLISHHARNGNKCMNFTGVPAKYLDQDA